MVIEITTYYLEMTAPQQLRPKRALGSCGAAFDCGASIHTVQGLGQSKAVAHSGTLRSGLSFRRVDPPKPELNQFFYATVGRDWLWVDRLPWTLDRWREYVTRPELETWVLWVDDDPAGYVEMEQDVLGGVELVYFGLVPQYIGQGLGGYLLTEAVEQAWRSGARRVWLHTCSLDHPAALTHYQARGFRLYRQEHTVKELPDGSRGSLESRLAGALNGPIRR